MIYVTLYGSQTDIDALLAHLQTLREQIAAARTAVEPLEANLAYAYSAFQAVVGGLRREAVRLQAELVDLRAHIDAIDRHQDAAISLDPGNNIRVDDENPKISQDEVRPIIDPEAMEKDKLLEHIFRVLDPDTNHQDAELLANLKGMCDDPTITLAALLEEVPWGAAWTARNPLEDLAGQHRRLEAWEQVLARQLVDINHIAERLRNDRRYGLWQQLQKGPDAWRTFLHQAAEEQQEYNAELRAELDALHAEWARMTGSA